MNNQLNTICPGCKRDIIDPKVLSCTIINVENNGNKYKRLIYLPLELSDSESERCPGCNVAPGGVHHFPCKCEICCICMGEMVTCPCFKV